MILKEYQRELEQLNRTMRELSVEIPDALVPFLENERLHAMTSELDAKTKEFIGLAMAIVQRSEGCILLHIKNALKHGASNAEILDTIGVAIREAGSPAVIAACDAYRALVSLEKETGPALLYDD